MMSHFKTQHQRQEVAIPLLEATLEDYKCSKTLSLTQGWKSEKTSMRKIYPPTGI